MGDLDNSTGSVGLGPTSTQTFTDAQINDHINALESQGLTGQALEQKIYEDAQARGVTAEQLESARGWEAGTVNNWTTTNNQTALPSATPTEPTADEAQRTALQETWSEIFGRDISTTQLDWAISTGRTVEELQAEWGNSPEARFNRGEITAEQLEGMTTQSSGTTDPGPQSPSTSTLGEAPADWNPYSDANNEYVHDQVLQNLNDPWETLQSRNLEQQYTNLEVQDNEILNGTEMAQTNVGNASQAQSAGDVNLEQLDYDTSVIAREQVTSSLEELNNTDPMQAASMVEHLTALVDELEDGTIPQWARPAVTKVEQMLASRGISASSVGRDSLFNAIISAAMPLAQQDSQYEQEANKVNYQARVQAIFSDVSTENARLQFNATSENQKNQFVNQLTAQVDGQNRARREAISQWNAGQENGFKQFQANLDQQRSQFNAQMANVVEQSNVQWRRQVNQINTAGTNAVNQANVQNAFNLSNQALSFLWQEMRDEATFAFKASQAEKDRRNQLEASLLANEAAAGGEIGVFFKNVADGLGLFDTVTDQIFGS